MSAKPLPPHIGESVDHVASLHAEHYLSTAPLQRIVNKLTSIIGRPGTWLMLTVLIAAWLVSNFIVATTGGHAWDAPPYVALEISATLGALLISGLILVTQRHENQLADRREQLTLQLAIVNEQKVAKLIELVEQMRRDDPSLRNRKDAQAEEMSVAADPSVVIEALNARGVRNP